MLIKYSVQNWRTGTSELYKTQLNVQSSAHIIFYFSQLFVGRLEALALDDLDT